MQQGPGPWALTSAPDILAIELLLTDQCLIIATDGLWDVMTNEQAVTLALEYGNAKYAARALVDRALFWGTRDNVSAIVLFFAWDVQIEAVIVSDSASIEKTRSL